MLTFIKTTVPLPVVRGLVNPLPIFAVLYACFQICFYGLNFGLIVAVSLIYDYLPMFIMGCATMSGFSFLLLCKNMNDNDAKLIKGDNLIISFTAMLGLAAYLFAIWCGIRYFFF